MMNKEETAFQKRLIDLAVQADRRNQVLFSEFLNLNELHIFHSSAGELSFVNCRLFGGYETAERQMIAWIPDALSYLSEEESVCSDSDGLCFPIRCLQILPLHEKYAETLSHRDYLGAILNLGLERSRIGDILVTEKGTWVFAHETVAEFLCRELTRVRHTSVQCRAAAPGSFRWEPKLETIRGTVASVRLDSLISLAFGGSRSSLSGLIEGGKVFVNGRLITSNGFRVKEQDLISVRGYGRFRYCGEPAETKKGRLYVTVEKFV